ncbi:Tat pathway signal sequence domain protein [Asticcacaulis endophyticus]|uniref:Tat pathway signal sequence domain protein n=1 Tax=Asticcacaulis endophyticus TaxID=1395890 RepID=A0A918QC27_9CAUL|nr:Tat pathway signal sequence domain protein [Asticcacaulis endophyticus]GGZ39379.1 hypothetical protein GCM10011273_27330 [Asticcacaulis endophyticus]
MSLISSIPLRQLLAGMALAAVALSAVPTDSIAQSRRGDRDSGRENTEKSAADKEKDKEEWEGRDLRLDKRRADGPCPFVKVLYDAARYQDFEGGKVASASAKWTGEINGVVSDCAYRGGEPIELEMMVGFSLGRGPAAEGNRNNYRYWVAVTDKDQAVLAKEYFDLPVTFADGQSRVDVATKLENIVIPRAASTVAGSNFEVLVGFDVTPEMAEFNREGKRFRYVTSAQ